MRKQVQVLVPVTLPEERGIRTQSEYIEPQLGSALPGKIIIVDETVPFVPEIVDSLPGKVDPANQPSDMESIVLVNVQGQINTRTHLQKQLAEVCNNAQPAQALSVHCYYFSQ